jgi:FlaA1/EpsC-like NDP-sugar epimerase
MSVRALLFHHIDSLSRVRKRRVFLIVDMALALLAFLIAPIFFPDFGSLRSIAFFAALSGIAAVASIAVGLPRIKLNAYGRHAVLATAKFAALVTLGICGLCQITKISFDALSIAEFGVLLFFGSFVGRYTMLMALLWVLRHGQTRRRVLIYGAGDTGLQMAIALRNHQRILPVAFLDDDPDLQAVTVAGLSVLSPERLETTLPDLAVERVLLAMPSASASKLAVITRKLLALGLHVQALPSFAQLAGTEAMVPLETTDLQGQFLGRDAVVCNLPKLDTAYAGKVVLVTGAGGSVGSELCRQLITHKPKTLVLFERSEIALYTIDQELRDLARELEVQIVPVLGSVTDALHAYSTMVEARAEVVFHAAAYKHVPLVEANPVAGLANNFIGTRTFAEAAVSAGVAQFVLISTDKAVRPSSVMGATKRLAELVVQDLANRSPGTRFSIVRFGNVMGSSGSVLPLFREQIARGGPITLTHEDVTRYFMTLAEAARLVLLSDAFSQAGGLCNIFVLDMGRPVKIRDLAERMIKAQGLTLKDHDNPAGDIEIVITGLRRGEKLHEEPLISGRSWPTPHPKILRAQEVALSEFAMASALNAARAAIQAGDQLAARTMIGTWVEGFPQATLDPSGTFEDRNEKCSA